MTISQSHPDRDTLSQPASMECSLVSYAISRLTFDDVNALRKQSATLAGNLGYSILRHVEEQTLAAMAAAGDAIRAASPALENFSQWGIVASSRYLGRSSFIQTLCKFAKEGPWNVSVQVVPNRSLHSPASTLGLAIGCHGPCVGVGGGLDGETDAWVTALALLEQHQLDGIWVIFCGWDPDEKINIEGITLNDVQCTALALALKPVSNEPCLARMRILLDPAAPTAMEIPARQTMLSKFEQFIANEAKTETLTINLGGCLKTEIDWSPAQTTTIPIPQQSPSMPKKAA